MTDRLIRARKLPSRGDVADHFGVSEINVGTIYPPTRYGLDGRVDVNIDGHIERVGITIDRTADWPPRPSARQARHTRSKSDRVFPRVVVPERIRLERERREVAEADARRMALVEANHFRALDHLAREVVLASSVSGCRPAWAVAAEAVDRSRAHTVTASAASHRSGPTMLAEVAFGLDGREPDHSGGCLVCSTKSDGGNVCTDCLLALGR